MNVEMYEDDNGVRRPMLGTLTKDDVDMAVTGAGLVARRRQRIDNATATITKVKSLTGSLSGLGVALHAGHDEGTQVPDEESVADSGLGEPLAAYLDLAGVGVGL